MEPYEYLYTKLALLNEKIKNIYGLNLKIELLLNLKGYRLIGQCKKVCKNTYTIRLHKKLLESFKEIYIDDVLTHELAHAVQMELYLKSKPHSNEWKSILQTLSGKKYSTKNKIDYNLENVVKRRRFIYVCECMEHFISTILHNKIQYKKNQYRCKKCKSNLVFKEE